MAVARHERTECQVVIDVLVSINVAKLAPLAFFGKDRIRIVSPVVAGYPERKPLQIMFVRFRRFRRAAHVSI